MPSIKSPKADSQVAGTEDEEVGEDDEAVAEGLEAGDEAATLMWVLMVRNLTMRNESSSP